MPDPFEEDDVDGLFPGSTLKKLPEEEVLAGAGPWQLEVPGVPRTKKTSNETHLSVNKKYVVGWVRSLAEKIHDPAVMMRAVLSRVKVQPSSLYRKWAKKSPIMMPGIDPRIFPLGGDLHIRAIFYRERAVGDLLGFEQGIADMLQERGIVENDRQFVCWDGSRLDKDKGRPRVEITLTLMDGVPRPESTDQLSLTEEAT